MKDEVLTLSGNIVKELTFTAVNWGDTGIGLMDTDGPEDQEPDRDDGYIGSSVIDVVNFKYGAFWIGNSWNKIMVMTPPIVEVIGNVHENPELLEGTSNND